MQSQPALDLQQSQVVRHHYCYPLLHNRVTKAALVALVMIVVASSALSAQSCTEPHYRWSEKIDASMKNDASASVDVSDILSWSPRNTFRKDKCAARAGREKKVFEVTGWVRRIKKGESDHDWHIEITEEEDDPVKQCVIVEIPAGDNDAIFQQARDDLTAVLSGESAGPNGDYANPIQVTFVGAALFDGFHQKVLTNGKRKASGHGRCNASVSALWELHPIYKVKAADQP
jgi:hypothetical protein